MSIPNTPALDMEPALTADGNEKSGNEKTANEKHAPPHQPDASPKLEAVDVAHPDVIPVDDMPPEDAAPLTTGPAPPPDGGFQAWLQVAAAFMLYWNSLGLLNGFGAYQTYYGQVLLSNESSSAISWIGSVQIFLLMAGGFFFGPLFDLGYARAMLIVGTFLLAFGFMMTSLATRYYEVLLAQGFCVGIGTGCLYIPAITLVPSYFSSKRALAMGVASIGSSLGAALYPLIFEKLQPRIGFPWTMRTIGFIALLLCSTATAVAKPRLKRASASSSSIVSGGRSFQRLRQLSRDAQLLDVRYLVQCVAIFFSNLGFFQPLYYLQSYAEGHGTPASLAQYLLVILNMTAIPGRLGPSMIADRYGVVATFCIICIITAAIDYYWISVQNQAGNLAFAVLYGFFSSSVVTLAPVVLSNITPDLTTLGTRLGCVAVLKGIASLIGPPIAGAILDNSGSYLGVQLFTAVAMTLTALFSFVMYLTVRRMKQSSWV
ncbi:hypothetical protein SCUCBS95973_008214 [Sporothrix curviconia]|uniref:Major facilitator superfamily (MFS) profile domain-containing protein n=1 Tax=Sporothrix curviconia TaxID=1260050 RepID=A0ABP0CJM9_9PEZI